MLHPAQPLSPTLFGHAAGNVDTKKVPADRLQKAERHPTSLVVWRGDNEAQDPFAACRKVRFKPGPISPHPNGSTDLFPNVEGVPHVSNSHGCNRSNSMTCRFRFIIRGIPLWPDWTSWQVFRIRNNCQPVLPGLVQN